MLDVRHFLSFFNLFNLGFSTYLVKFGRRWGESHNNVKFVEALVRAIKSCNVEDIAAKEVGAHCLRSPLTENVHKYCNTYSMELGVLSIFSGPLFYEPRTMMASSRRNNHFAGFIESGANVIFPQGAKVPDILHICLYLYRFCNICAVHT